MTELEASLHSITVQALFTYVKSHDLRPIAFNFQQQGRHDNAFCLLPES
jgi:hypothetical protein